MAIEPAIKKLQIVFTDQNAEEEAYLQMIRDKGEEKNEEVDCFFY
jgi:hypothetical protein